LQTFLDDPIYREEHALHLELVSTFARVGPNAEQKFRDECMYIGLFIRKVRLAIPHPCNRWCFPKSYHI
jgi:hypothetical protein